MTSSRSLHRKQGAVQVEDVVRPSNQVLGSLSRGLRGHPQFQVLQPVVVAPTVFVMRAFIRQESTSEGFSQYKAVFRHTGNSSLWFHRVKQCGVRFGLWNGCERQIDVPIGTLVPSSCPASFPSWEVVVEGFVAVFGVALIAVPCEFPPLQHLSEGVPGIPTLFGAAWTLNWRTRSRFLVHRSDLHDRNDGRMFRQERHVEGSSHDASCTPRPKVGQQ